MRESAGRLVLRFAAEVLLLCLAAPPRATGAQGSAARSDSIDFGSDRWNLENATVSDHLGRKSLAGVALLEDADFANGVIEVDVAMNVTAPGASSYPGIVFRVQSEQDLERFYLRPHRAGRYPDAVQYVPTFSGVAGWQLYSGDGFTAGCPAFPTDHWVHLRLEVMGKQARLLVGDSPAPVLVATDLKHGLSRGSVGLLGPRDGTAYFSNFQLRGDDGLRFEPPPPVDVPPGVVTHWMLSQPFKLRAVDLERPLADQKLPKLEWRAADGEPGGLVDISRHIARPQGERGEPDCVFARSTIRADQDEVRRFAFGYSDAVSISLEGRVLFTGSSAYRERDPSFLGIVGLFDNVYLPLRKGDNDLTLLVVESFGGWGFICQDASVILQDATLVKSKETQRVFLNPESATYDPRANVFYVSNTDVYNAAAGGAPGGGAANGSTASQAGQFLSKLSPAGEVLQLRWVEGLQKPTGMAVRGDTLYVLERTDVGVIDAASGATLARIPVPGARFLNDIALDSSGVAYISDSGGTTIFRLAGGSAAAWVTSPELVRPNGLVVDGDKLVVACNGDRRLKTIDLATRQIDAGIAIPPGIMDGVALYGDGSYLVSHNEGRLFRVTPAGQIAKLLDLTTQGTHCAAFEFVPDKNLLVIPTWLDNRVLFFRVRS